MSRRRVVVTGLGIISPVGNTVADAWANILAGKSGIGPITRFDASGFPTHIAGEVKNFDATQYIAAKEARRFDTFIHYGLAAAIDALKDSGLDLDKEDRTQIGVCIGSGIGGLPLIEDTQIAYQAGGARKISPFFVPGTIINMISGQLSIMMGLKGPNMAVVSACTTANHSIGEAGRFIEYGDADVMVAGGTEAAVCRLGMAGFAAARALSTNFNDTPEKASRPWDKDRDGFVMGEGSGCVVLEEYEHAKARGAKIYAEIVGYGMSGDAYHLTAPAPDGNGGFRAMKAALKRANMTPADIDYINAHGTSTPLGDEIEVGAVKRLFGDHAKSVSMSSTKSAIGHLLGAAGSVEAIFSILAMRDQVAPPTLNLENPSPSCEGIDLVPKTAKERKIRAVLSNSFGFGGTNASLIFTAAS